MTPPSPLILGIETSCDETAAAVVRNHTAVLSNTISSQHDLHRPYKGVVPEIASRAHAERISQTITQALSDAGVSLDDLTAVAVGNRPGLIGSLLIGTTAAKALAWSLNVPLVGVDHVHAHLYAGLLDSDQPEPAFPALGLVVSGGHTSIYRCNSPTHAKKLGGTIDDAIGEAFDKVAIILGLPHPGGPRIDTLAKQGNDRAHDFPISRLAKDSLDFSFSGLKTSVLYTVAPPPLPPNARPDKQQPTPIDRDNPTQLADVAASFQRAAVAAIILKLNRAFDQHPDCRTLLVGGGVSANSLLRAQLQSLAKDRSLDLRLPPMPYCMDNAAMIAGLASRILTQRNNTSDPLSLTADPTSLIEQRA